MSYGLADHAYLEITAAVIAAASETVWTKVGTLVDCLALNCFNDLDYGFLLKFNDKIGGTVPAVSSDPHYKFAAGEGMFVDYRTIGQMFGSCDVFVRKLSADPTVGSFRITGITRAPLKFKG